MRSDRWVLVAAVAVFIAGVIAIFWASDLPVVCVSDFVGACNPHARILASLPVHISLLVVLFGVLVVARFDKGRARFGLLIALVILEVIVGTFFFVLTENWKS